VRRLSLLVVLATLLGLAGTSAVAAQDDPEAARAARAIAAAQAKANEAAAAYEEATGRLDALETEIAAIEASRTESQRRLDDLAVQVRQLAVRGYVRSDAAARILPVGGDLGATVRAETLARFVVLGRTDAIDQYRAVNQDLARADASLRQRREEQRAAVEAAEEANRSLQAELTRLRQVEAERQAELRRRREEEARRRAAEEAARRAAEQAAAQAAARARQEQAARDAAARQGGGRSGGNPATTTPATSPPTTARPSSGGSGGSSGSSGGGRAASIVCPVRGAVAFVDSWGAGRSGGRRHQGVDMMAARGTPVVAPVSGTVQLRSVSLGGLSFFVYGDDGNTYFGTHMDGYEGASGRRVSAGEVIGYVGSTGNASAGAPHLHFEVKPGGGASVNPYPWVRAAC